MRSVALFTLVGLLFGCGATEGPSSPTGSGGAASGGDTSSTGGADATGGSLGGGDSGGTQQTGGAATGGTGGVSGARCDWVPVCASVTTSCTLVYSSTCGAAQFGTFSCGSNNGWAFNDGTSFACSGSDCDSASSSSLAYCAELDGTGGSGGTGGASTGGSSTGGASGGTGGTGGTAGSGGAGGSCTDECVVGGSAYCTGLKTRQYCKPGVSGGCATWQTETCLSGCMVNPPTDQCI